MAKTLLEQYEEYKKKRQDEEQQASQPKYTIPDSGSILEKYQAYKQQRQAEEQKAISAKRINNPSHLGNVMKYAAVQNTQRKQAEAARIAKDDETRRQKQEDAQKHLDTVNRLTEQYMPVRPEPIPQVDINKKYGPASKAGGYIARAGVSDAPFGFGKIIDLSQKNGQSYSLDALDYADRERREQAERDRKDKAARDELDARIAKEQRAQLEREHTAALAKLYSGTLSSEEYAAQEALAGELADRLNGDDKRVDAVNKPQNKPVNGWDYDANRAQDLRRVEQEDEIASKYQLQPTAPRQYTENETVVAAEQAKQSITDLTAERDRLRKDIETLDTVLKWPVGRQDVAGYQNFTFAQAQRPQAEKALTDVENKLKEQTKALQWAEDKATVMNLRKQYNEAEPDMKGFIGVSLKAAEFRQQFNQKTDGQKAFDVMAETISQGFRQAGQDYLNISKPILRLFGLPESTISKDNQKAMEESARVMEMQVQNSSEFVGYAQQVVSSAVRMAPTVVLSLLSGGTSTAVQAASGIQLAGAGLGAHALNATKELVKSPQFLNMWATAFGNYYTEEEAKGKNPLIASIGAGIKATVNAMIEMGGGIQTAAAKPTGWQTLKETVFEEAGEEVKQGIADRAYDYSQSGNVQNTKTKDIVSLDNPGSVISGKQMIEEGLLGGSVAALMGGVQQGALMAINGPNADYQERSEYNYPEANIDQQIAQKEAEIAKLESDALETAARERMETNLRDTQAETKYNELVQLVTETFPAESATVQKITEATPITIKRMEEIATGAIGEFTELMRSNPELAEKADAVKQAVVGLFGGIRDSGARTIERAREYGQAGIRIDDLIKEMGELPDEARQAYVDGAQTAKQLAAEQEANIKEMGPQQGRKGILRSISVEEASKNQVEQIGKITPVIRAATNALRGFAEDTGLNITLFDSPVNDAGQHVGKQGWYDRNTQTIFLDVKSGYGNEEAIMRTAAHEITHFIKQYAPAYYENNYKQNIINSLYDGDPGALMRMVKDQIRKAADNGKTQTISQAMDDVIADASETMLFGGQATLKKLVGENPKLFVRVKRWIDNFVKALQRAVQNIKADSEGAKLLSKSYDEFKKIQSNYWRAMQEASVNLRGEIQAEEMSAYEEAHEKAQAAKNAKIGTAVSVPGQAGEC